MAQQQIHVLPNKFNFRHLRHVDVAQRVQRRRVPARKALRVPQPGGRLLQGRPALFWVRRVSPQRVQPHAPVVQQACNRTVKALARD